MGKEKTDEWSRFSKSGFLGVFRQSRWLNFHSEPFIERRFPKYMQFSSSRQGEVPEECHMMLVVRTKTTIANLI